jgi:hypothetical protein
MTSPTPNFRVKGVPRLEDAVSQNQEAPHDRSDDLFAVLA